MKRIAHFAVTALAAMLVMGCHVTSPTPPLAPGAVNSFDQASYTTLITTKAVIDSLKASYAASPQLAAIKPYLNQAIADYNVAEAAWQTYHVAATPINQNSVNAAIAAVQTDIAAIQGAIK